MRSLGARSPLCCCQERFQTATHFPELPLRKWAPSAPQLPTGIYCAATVTHAPPQFFPNGGAASVGPAPAHSLAGRSTFEASSTSSPSPQRSIRCKQALSTPGITACPRGAAAPGLLCRQSAPAALLNWGNGPSVGHFGVKRTKGDSTSTQQLNCLPTMSNFDVSHTCVSPCLR